MAENTVDVPFVYALMLLDRKSVQDYPRKMLELVASCLCRPIVKSGELDEMRRVGLFTFLASGTTIEMPFGPQKAATFESLQPILDGRYDRSTAAAWHNLDRHCEGRYSRVFGSLTSRDDVSLKEDLPILGQVALDMLKTHNPLVRFPKIDWIAGFGGA